MKTIAIIARIILGAVFIFSGFVKEVDPLGSTYKFIDYFTAFGLPFLSPTAFTLAVLQNAVEVVIGVALVLGLRMKESAWGVLLFMGFYTVLTFILALTNPVSDCGCFGDALILTNWQTFYKNIVLLALAIIVFVYRRKYQPAYTPVVEWGWVVGITVIAIGISIHCYNHLPLFDFRPYSIGTSIPQGMLVPEGMPANEYRTTLYYEKDGVTKAFSETDYPWEDTTWVWKDSKTELVKEGYQPPIHDFSITTLEGDDITDEVLNFEGYTFLAVAHRLDKSNRQALSKANEIAGYCQENGHRFYCLTASSQDDIEKMQADLGLVYDFCFTDEITLKTIIRSNPGFVLIREGTILNKWHHNDMPEISDFSDNLTSFSIKEQTAKSEKRLLNEWFWAFAFFALIFYQFRRIE